MWFVVALIVGGIIGSLVLLLRNRDIRVTWYEWVIGIAGVLLLLFTFQNYFGSIDEAESEAAGLFWLITGLPAIVLLALALGLAWRHHRTKVT